MRGFFILMLVTTIVTWLGFLLIMDKDITFISIINKLQRIEREYKEFMTLLIAIAITIILLMLTMILYPH